MSESQRRGKNENKKAKKWFMPTEQRWREGFFIIGLFLRVPDSLAERRRQGDRGVLSLSNTHTDRKDSSNCGGVQEDTRRVWDRGDVETSINHRRLITVATVLSLAKLVTPKQNTHMHWLTKQHTTTAVRKASENTHTHTLKQYAPPLHM